MPAETKVTKMFLKMFLKICTMECFFNEKYNFHLIF